MRLNLRVKAKFNLLRRHFFLYRFKYGESVKRMPAHIQRICSPITAKQIFRINLQCSHIHKLWPMYNIQILAVCPREAGKARNHLKNFAKPSIEDSPTLCILLVLRLLLPFSGQQLDLFLGPPPNFQTYMLLQSSNHVLS